MKPGLREIYRIGVGGNVDKNIVFSSPEKAIGEAYRLWNKVGKSVAVYGYCEDCEHTRFWRHWRITETGFISPDGR